MSEKKKNKPRGSGYLYQKPPGSGNFYVQYYTREYSFEKQKVIVAKKRERIGHVSEREAQKQLRAKLAKIDRGEAPDSGRCTVADLHKALRKDVETHLRPGSRKLNALDWHWKHLAPVFAAMRATDVTAVMVTNYKHQRMNKEHAALATAQRELGTLRRLFRYGREQGLVVNVPVIKLVKENNVRKGFVEPDGYARLVVEANKEGVWLRTLVEMAWAYGWRRGELLGLQVRNVDLLSRLVRLDVGTTKNEQGREVPMTPTIHGLLSVLCTDKVPDAAVFTRDNGTPIRCFTGAWRNMCIRAGLGHWECSNEDCSDWKPRGRSGWGTQCACGGQRKYVGTLLHDFRRSCARNYRHNAVAENVVMSITGHKTRAMLDRYSIVNNDDQRRAIAKLEDLQFGPQTTPAGAEAANKGAKTIQ